MAAPYPALLEIWWVTVIPIPFRTQPHTEKTLTPRSNAPMYPVAPGG